MINNIIDLIKINEKSIKHKDGDISKICKLAFVCYSFFDEIVKEKCPGYLKCSIKNIYENHPHFVGIIWKIKDKEYYFIKFNNVY